MVLLTLLVPGVVAHPVAGDLNQVTDPLNDITHYGYDELGDKTTQTDALGHVTTWSYDGLGRATNHTLPDSRYETMAYDTVGRLHNRTDYAGDATAYQYDAADRVTRQTFADGSVIATTYTADGQIASLTDIANGTSKITKYSYDARDRLTDIVYPDQSKLHYAYDAAGEKTSEILTTPDGQSQQIDYTYDPDGNLSTVTADGKTFTYHYDADNRKTERDDPNGVVTTYTYDANGRLTNWTTTNGPAILAEGDYTLNAAGQRTALAYTGPDGQTRNLVYSYDGAGRLTGETRSLPQHDTTWTLDAVGNRTKQVLDGATNNYAFDTTDRLTAISGANPATYTWDQDGQLKRKTDTSGTTNYTFNVRGQLTGVALPDGSTIAYAYGPDGNIASRTKTAGSTTSATNYLVDPNLAYAQVVAEYGTDGHATAIYVYGDELLMRITPTTTTDYHHDGLGSVTLLTDDAGNPVQTYGYGAWGNLIESTGTDPNPYQFAGERFDVDTGLIYLRARWYDPSVGRFVARDSLEGRQNVPASLNRFVYAGDDPVNLMDRSGNDFSLASVGSAINISANLAGVAVTSYNFGTKLYEGDYKGAAYGAARDAVFWALGAGAGKLIAPLSKAAIGLFSRQFIVPLEYGLPRSGAVLTRNMEAVMAKVGMLKPAGWQAHHIVGEAYAEGRETMAILRKFNIDANSPLNGVFLPGCGATGTQGIVGLAVHCGKHLQKYERYVLDQLQGAGSEADVVNALTRIRDELLDGELSLNARGNL